MVAGEGRSEAGGEFGAFHTWMLLNFSSSFGKLQLDGQMLACSRGWKEQNNNNGDRKVSLSQKQKSQRAASLSLPNKWNWNLNSSFCKEEMTVFIRFF